MRRPPNYHQERTQKNRVRESKQQEKLQRREEASARRKALREGEPGVDDVAGGGAVVDKTANSVQEQTPESGREGRTDRNPGS